MLGAIGKSFTSHLNNIKRLNSKEVQSLPLSERLKIAHEGSKSAFKGEEVFLSNSVTNFPPPPPLEDQEESFVSHPEQITNQPQVQLELPFKVKDNTTGENYELHKNGKGPALAILNDDSPKMDEVKTGNENKKELASGKGMKVIDGEVYLNGRIMDPETGEPGDKGYWTYGDKVVTGKKAEIIGGDIFVDGKEWDPATGEFTGTCYWPAGDKKIFGKEAIALSSDEMKVDGVLYNSKTGEKIEKSRSFMEGVEWASDGINKGIGVFGGGVLGAMGAAELVAAGTVGTVVAGPVAAAALLIIGGGALAGGVLGYKGGKKLSDLAGKAGAWISKKLGGSEHTGRAMGKAALTLGATAPISVVTTAAGVTTIGGAALSGGLMAGSGVINKVECDIIHNLQEKAEREAQKESFSKPDISAPKVGVFDTGTGEFTEMKDFKGDTSELYRDAGHGTHVNSVKLEGTDFSAPLVTGTAAAMLQANPDLTPGEIKEILNKTAGENKVVNPEAAVKYAADLKKLEGTDFAAPVVAGTVASMLSAYPNLTPGEIKEILKLTSGENKEINIKAALKMAEDANKLKDSDKSIILFPYATEEPGYVPPFTIENPGNKYEAQNQNFWRKHRGNKGIKDNSFGVDLNKYYRES